MSIFAFCVKTPTVYIRLFLLSFFVLVFHLQAIDVDPSKKTVPEKFNKGSGNRFSIFAGDPDRIKKANSIDFSDFEGKVTLEPASLSLATAESQFKSIFKTTFAFLNKGKRTYTLSYPNSQRFDILIRNSAGQVCYQWSSDKIFMEVIGTSLVNPNDKISQAASISLHDFDVPAAPGIYSVEVVVANYPELTAKGNLTITP